MSDVISGTAYVARIKDPSDAHDLYNKRDLLHAIFYTDGTEKFDFTDLRELIEQDNKMVFYTKLVNKHLRDSFTWDQCKKVLDKVPPIGSVCHIIHDKPLISAPN